MKLKSVTLFEWEQEKEPKDDETGKPIKLDEKDVKLLKKINKKLKSAFKSGNDIITVLEGRNLRTYNYVGVIQIRNKRIQILPKLYKNKSACAEISQKNFLYMLSLTKKIQIKKASSSIFKTYTHDFLEFYIRIFLDELEETLRSHIFREYVPLQENLSTLRGKIALTHHILKNEIRNNHARIYCEFDELTEDNLINQTIKYTLKLLNIVSKDYRNINRINQIRFIFDEITDKHILLHHQKKIHFTRLNEKFRPIIDTCFLFINNLSIDLAKGATNYGAIMFDMNELFEEFVARFISKYKTKLGLDNFEVKSQYTELDPLGVGAKEIRLKPDVVIMDSNNIELILDTKYKVLKNQKPINDVSNQDIYQMLAYGLRGECSNIVLLYPRPENYGGDSEEPIVINLHEHSKGMCAEHLHLPRNVKIYIQTIDIMLDDLKKEKSTIIRNLREIFKDGGLISHEVIS